jgi:hypothetical protein
LLLFASVLPSAIKIFGDLRIINPRRSTHQ